MAVNVQQRGEKHQLRVKHRLLPKAFFFTFDTEPEARAYGDQLQRLLDGGVVPLELLEQQAAGARRTAGPLVIEAIRAYLKTGSVTDSDDALLGQMLPELAGVRVGHLTYAWAAEYVSDLKLKRNLAPSSIRKRVGVLARVIDAHHRLAALPGQQPPANALRLLPRGYSTYSSADAAKLEAQDKGARRDVQRDRRLTPDEEARVRAALAGEKRPDRERALEPDPELRMLFDLVVDTGLRLREAYRLRADQVDLKHGLLHVEGSKGHRGVVKPRAVPLKAALLAKLRQYLRGRVGLLFGFWDGSPDDLDKCTRRLSARFSTLFSYAQVDNVTEHDLRHEATCRWVELRSAGGGWVFSDVEVCRIMGWRDPRMMLRYASLRGEDLAARLRTAV